MSLSVYYTGLATHPGASWVTPCVRSHKVTQCVCHAVPPTSAWPLGKLCKPPPSQLTQASGWFTPHASHTSCLMKLSSVCACGCRFCPLWNKEMRTAHTAAGVERHRETDSAVFRSWLTAENKQTTKGPPLGNTHLFQNIFKPFHCCFICGLETLTIF